MKCGNSKCSLDANPSFGSGKFCSRKCANARNFSVETKSKISNSLKQSAKLNANKPKRKLTDEELAKWRESIKKTYKNKYDSMSFDELSIWKKRDRLISEQQGKCADCGLSEWKSQPISLELDHKDGNTDNNSRENLWMICPNCHSTTDTWRGRNKPRLNGENKVDDDTLIVALQTHSTIRKALLSVGLAAKGGNYNRAKELKKLINA